MAGRGKKIHCGYSDRLTPRRRPGEVDNTQPNAEIVNLVEKIKQFDLKNFNSTEIGDIEVSFGKICQSKENLESIISYIHHYCGEDNEFCYKFILSFENLLNNVIDGVTVRTVLLQYVQKDHSARENVQSTDANRFITNVALLGAIYQCVKINGSPIHVLGPALIEYLELILLSDDEAEFKQCAIQIFINGPTLQQLCTEAFKELTITMRYTLMNRTISSLCRAWLLLALDIAQILPSTHIPLHLQKFYVSAVGREYLELENSKKYATLSISKSFQENVTLQRQQSGQFYDEENIKTEVDQIREKMKQNGLFNKLKIDNEKVKKKTKVRNWRDGEKLSDDEKIWGLNQRGSFKSGSEGHDDRCDKDDDFYGVQLPRNELKTPKQGILKKSSPSSVPLPEESWD